MSNNDPIADFLTRIRNAILVGHDEITLPSSKPKVEVARVLKEQGYIQEYGTAPSSDFPGDELTVRLRYDDDRRPVLTGLKRISKPGRRIFVAKQDIPRVLGGMGTTIMSTSGGIMTGHEATKKGLGGEIWGRGLVAMSRIGVQPIAVPDSVTVTIEPGNVAVKGPKGELTQKHTEEIVIKQDEGILTITRPSDSKEHKSQHGLVRALVANMVNNCANGYEKRLEIQGVGYRAALKGKNIELQVGYSHPVLIEPPEGVTIEVPIPTQVIVSGADSQAVGEIAARIRKTRPPEPYKGKGIRYADEHVQRKVGKRA